MARLAPVFSKSLYPWQSAEALPAQGSEKVIAGVRAAMCRWGGIFRRKQRGRRPDPTRLSGRLLVGKLVHHLNAGVCADHDEVTVAICQNALRVSARKGDLLLLVSRKGPSSLVDPGGRGIAIAGKNQRLALCAAVVTDVCPIWNYHSSKKYPANGNRADQIYSVEVIEGTREMLQERSAISTMAPLEPLSETRSWLVVYRSGVEVQYTLKKTARFHRLPGEGCNAVSDAARFTDFNGPALRCRIFTVLPGQDYHQHCQVFPARLEKFLGARHKVFEDPPKKLWDFTLSLWGGSET